MRRRGPRRGAPTAANGDVRRYSAMAVALIASTAVHLVAILVAVIATVRRWMLMAPMAAGAMMLMVTSIRLMGISRDRRRGYSSR